MTYAKAKKAFINKFENEDIGAISSFVEKIKSEYSFPKIILSVGEGSPEASAFLYSILMKASKKTAMAKEYFSFEPYEMFVCNEKYISALAFSDYVDFLLKHNISGKNTLSLFISLMLACEQRCEYLILSCQNIEYYNNILANISLFPILILFSNQSEKFKLPDNTKEFVKLSSEDNFDYISDSFNEKGTRISLVSSNKLLPFRASILGSEFYYMNEPFLANIFQEENLIFACLAIEGARLLSIPKSKITLGIKKAILPFEFDFYSLSPLIALKAIKPNDSNENILNSIKETEQLTKQNIKIFSLDEFSDYKYNSSFYLRKNISQFIKENKGYPLLFMGDLNFVSKIKKELNLIKKERLF